MCTSQSVKGVPQACSFAKALHLTNIDVPHVQAGQLREFRDLKYLYLANVTLSSGALDGLINLRFLQVDGRREGERGHRILDNAFFRGTGSHLDAMSWSDYPIRGIAANAFARLPWTFYMYFENNRMRSMPCAALRNAVSLTTLYVIHNHIGYVPSHCFRRLDRLRYLSLKHNPLVVMGPLHGNSIQRLFLQHTQLKEIPPIFRVKNNYSTVDLSHNQIGYVHHTDFKRVDTVEHLYLRNNAIRSRITKRTFEAFTHCLVLNLSTNAIRRIHPRAFEALPSGAAVDTSNNTLRTGTRAENLVRQPRSPRSTVHEDDVRATAPPYSTPSVYDRVAIVLLSLGGFLTVVLGALCAYVYPNVYPTQCRWPRT